MTEQDIQLRDSLVKLIVEKLLDKEVGSLTRPFSNFLNSNPKLLADAIVGGNKLTSDELVDIMGLSK